MLFTDVYIQMQGDKADHVTLGAIMSKYLERMNKSNDQLLKLAELIAKEEQAAAVINPDDIFKQINLWDWIIFMLVPVSYALLGIIVAGLSVLILLRKQN